MENIKNKLSEDLRIAISDYLFREFECGEVSVDDEGLIGIAYTEKEFNEVEDILSDEQSLTIRESLESDDDMVSFQVSFEPKTLKVVLHIWGLFIDEYDLYTTERAIEHFKYLDFDSLMCW